MNKKWIILSSTAVVLAVGGYLAKSKYDSLLKSTSEGLTLGKLFGKSIQQSNCMFGLKMKYASCNDTACELAANGYIAGCMETAGQDAFCDSIPNIQETSAAISWVDETCASNNLTGGKCNKYLHKFVSVCTEQKEGRELSNSELFESGFKKGLESD